MPLAPTFAPRVYDAILPRPEVRTVTWAESRIPAPPPIAGHINFGLFPYMVEPADCIDDPNYNRVTIQAAARTGKTVAAQCALLRIARFNPHPMGWAEPDEPSCRRVLKRTWQMADGCPDLADQLPPARLRSATAMQFVDCLVSGAWSGSPTTAADTSWYLLVKNEADKFSRRKKRGDAGEDVGEADFYDFIDERCVGFPGATIVELSTPAVKGSSRIEASRLAGDNRAYYVPCPHCNHFQTLRSGDGRGAGAAFRWHKNAEGRSTPDIARETAWYECETCRQKIHDEHRYQLMGAGRWVPEGQSLDKRGRLRGRPTRPGPHASFGPIGRHYSLLPGITWGSIAAEYVKAKRDPSGVRWRHFLNAVEGVTWDPQPQQVEPHELAERLKGDTDRGLCPEWTAFVTLAADVGSVGDQFYFYWMAVAWGPVSGPQFADVPRKRGQVVDWGVAVGEAEFLEVLGRDYEVQGGAPLRWVKGAVDSGYQGRGNDDNAIYRLCEKVKHLVPLKGSSTSTGPDLYAWGFKRSDSTKQIVRIKQRHGVGDLLLVNSPLTQSWRHNLVSGRTHRDAEEWCGLPADVCLDHEAHADLFDELLADRLIEEKWQNLGQSNEYGDALRYNRALAELYTRGGKRWSHLARSQPAAAAERRGSEERAETGRRTMQRRGFTRR